MFLFPAPSVVPTNLSAHDISRTTVLLKWHIEDPKPGFTLREYVISYRELEHGVQHKIVHTNSVQREATISDLRPFTTYEIKVAAATNFTGNYSTPVNVTTKEGGKKRIQLSRGNERKKKQMPHN